MDDRILKFADSRQFIGRIARSGENNTRSLAFDCSAALAEYPTAQIIAVIQRPQGDPYTVTPDADGTILRITLTSYDLEFNGHLQIELRVIDGNKILKSAIYTATVDDSIRGEADAPGQPVRDVPDRLDVEIKQAQAVVDDIRQKLENGEFNGSDAEVTDANIQAALGYTPADKVLVDQLTQEMTAFDAGARETEMDWGILVNHARDDGKFNTSYRVTGRMTNANPIPVSKNTRIIATELPDYLWAFAKYDASGTFLNGSCWMNISSQALNHDGYININFKRSNEGAVSEADAETIRNGVQIVSRDAIYIKTINSVAPDAYGNLNLDDVKETYAEIKLINGVTNGNTGKFEYTAANRATIADFISVVKGGKIIFTGAAKYNYSPIRLTSDMENVGYMGWIDSAEFELDYTGYLKLNIQRKDGGNMDAEELADIAKLIKVRTNPIDDPVYKYHMEVRADLINSITLEFNRTEGASYQLVRIPMTTNDGRKVRPVVRLTSVDGSLNGEKCSTLTYAKRENTAFAMNAGLFDVAHAVPLGQTIIDGVSIVNTPHPQGANGETISETECYPLCIDANGWLSAPYPKTVDTATMIADGVVQATTGWVKLVENYEIAADEIATEIVHPQPYVQNVIGQFDNGDYIVCSVSNSGYGDSAPNDRGLTYTQVAQILVDKGVKFAYALDGGGSAQTVLGMRHINPIYEGTAGRSIPSVIVFKAV